MLWIGQQGPVKPGRIRGIRRSRSEQAGIRHVHPHLLRHTFAVFYLRNGGDTLSMMKLLGHTSLSMTARYGNLTAVGPASKHRRHSPADLLGE